MEEKLNLEKDQNNKKKSLFFNNSSISANPSGLHCICQNNR